MSGSDAALAALARGDADMLARIAAARRAAPGDPQLVLAQAEAEVRLDVPDAGEGLAAILRQSPGWVEGQRQLASIRWERGEGEAALSGFVEALKADPANGGLWNGYIATLAACEMPGRAADSAAEARAAGFADPILLLIEAGHAGKAGEADRVARLLAEVPAAVPGRLAIEARHHLQVGDPAAAAPLLDQARAEAPGDVAMWALTELTWRALGDPRGEWLAGQIGLTSAKQIDLDDRLEPLLRSLHGTRHQPLGQSVRGGTQTRGRLFDRAEPEFARLKAALQSAVDAFVSELPPLDPAHPLLRHRARPIRVDGGWSVRLAPGGHHSSHVHAAGILSSACYIALPSLDAEAQEGWIELGRPPDDLKLAIGPRTAIEPKRGRLVLFPSYLYHGTRPFARGERLTVAFDAA